ncbi:Interferon-induced 44 family [Chlorella sorokiniana]|uniref:Interferon-induced 44 family n=1 Tax=Chlorella sorokiniana TaxID=3076 RepID=A0A2P6TRQ2_CHLSO|nr:Interferon-induced 44 family [Chlorella sorokiniana]|eukprot:PRW56741.1 Interferon-induced 44 family [Chlorella sorokiniana]
MRALVTTAQLSAVSSAAQPPRGARSRAAPPAAAAPTTGGRRLERRRPCVVAAAVQQTSAPAAAQEQGEQALLQGVIDGTELAGATLALAYDAQRDGWSADAFHSKVDGRGPALVVALTTGGALVGGYNPFGWSGEGTDYDSEEAFLFFLDDDGEAMVTLPKVGGPGGAVLRDAPGQGIWFADALVVPLAPGKERTIKSKLGAFYARKPNTARHLYAEGAPVKGGARGTELASLHLAAAAAAAMPSAAESVLLHYVMPIIGVILAIGVVASPTRTVWRTRKKSDIGDFNPLPTVVAVGNMCIWQGYALVSRDPFLTASSGIALLFAVSNTLILFGKTRQQMRDLLLVLMLIYLAIVLLFCTLTAHGRLPFRTVQLMWGIAANVGSCIYYISPLSTAMKASRAPPCYCYCLTLLPLPSFLPLLQVFRSRSSANIHVGNSVMSVVNATMWIGYLAGGKHIYLVPTFTYYTAAVFNLFCLYLCWRFPRRSSAAQVPSAAEPELAHECGRTLALVDPPRQLSEGYMHRNPAHGAFNQSWRSQAHRRLMAEGKQSEASAEFAIGLCKYTLGRFGGEEADE